MKPSAITVDVVHLKIYFIFVVFININDECL